MDNGFDMKEDKAGEIGAFEKWLAQNPGDADSWAKLAETMKADGDVDGAWQAWARARETFREQGRTLEAQNAGDRVRDLEKLGETLAKGEEVNIKHRPVTDEDESQDKYDPANFLYVPRRRDDALVGLAVGDAFGAPWEGLPAPEMPFGPLLEGPRDRMVAGPHGLEVGQVTDDTQMACVLAEALCSNKTDAANLLRLYREWRPYSIGIGNLTRRVLDMAPSLNPYEPARKAWRNSGKQAAGNGSLMRTAAIGVRYHTRRTARIETSIADSSVTHADPRCILACVAFNAILAFGINGRYPPGPPSSLYPGAVAKARSDIREAVDNLVDIRPEDATLFRAAEDVLGMDMEAAKGDDPGLYSGELHMHRNKGYVRVAFRLALWELLHAPTFEAALIDVVNRGGDTDTNAVITGALVGGYFGASEIRNIPVEWENAVFQALQDGPPGPLRDRYHLRNLIKITR